MSSNIVPKKKRTRAAPRRPEPRQDGACVSAKRGAAGAAGTRMGGGGPGAGAGAGRRTGHLLSEHRIAHRNAKSLEKTRTAWWALARHPQTPAHTRHGPSLGCLSNAHGILGLGATSCESDTSAGPHAARSRKRVELLLRCCAAAAAPLPRGYRVTAAPPLHSRAVAAARRGRRPRRRGGAANQVLPPALPRQQ